ncbi:MAG: cell division protein FtsA [Patescibacteria group bacterium]
MSKQNIISVIDIGTDKVVTLVADISEGPSQIRVMGVSSVHSKGIRKSQIVDLNSASEAITESVDAAERMAGMNIRQAYVSIGGQHIQSLNSKGVVAVAQPSQEITPDDVLRVIDAAKAVSLPSGKEIIHVIPKNYKVDSQDGIKDPVGMSGIRLETEAHIVTASVTALKNVEKCMNELGITVNEFVFSGLAASEVVVTETEKELGVVVVDIGAGTTSMCIFVEGSLEFSGVLPIGARHITQDIALGCRVSLESAEKIKIALGTLPPSRTVLPGETKDDARRRKKTEDTIDAQTLGIMEPIDTFSRKTLLEGIMVPRMKEMFEFIGQEIEKHQLFSKIPAGVVLAGGGADTVEIVEVCRHTLQLPTRVGTPTGFLGLIDEVEKPAFAASLGLLKYAASKAVFQSAPKQGFSLPSLESLTEVPKKIVLLIKSLLP